MFSMPVTTFGPKFEAKVAKATTGPEVQEVVLAVQFSPTLGISLSPLAGVDPSTVDTRAVFGEHDPSMIKPVVSDSHVSRTKISCTPPVAVPRFVAAEANATKRPSDEMTGSRLDAFAGVTPSGVEAIVLKGVVQPTVRIWHTACTKTSCCASGFGAAGPRFVAEDANATKPPPLETAGWELGALPGFTMFAE
jgi:hypothetical protein